MTTKTATLPIVYAATQQLPASIHYLYVQRDPLPSTLFAMNIPVDSTVERLRDLFTSIGGGRVSKVAVRGEEMEEGSARLWTSGSNAHIAFVDEAAASMSFSVLLKGAKFIWTGGPRDQEHRRKRPSFEQPFKAAHHHAKELDDKQDRSRAGKLSEPDQDGFVTVKRGPKAHRGSPLDQRRPKGKELKNFYRFQKREGSKKRMKKTLEDFKGDQQKIQQLKEKRQSHTE